LNEIIDTVNVIDTIIKPHTSPDSCLEMYAAARRAQARFSLVAKRSPQLLLGEYHLVKFFKLVVGKIRYEFSILYMISTEKKCLKVVRWK